MQATHSKEFQPSKILVPTDFSPSAERALEAANEMAQFTSAAIYLLHVIPMLPIVGMPEYPAPFFPEQQFLEDARGRAKEKLTVSVSLLDAIGVRAEFGIEIGNDVVGNILMVLGREHADMIVLSTHGMSGWRPTVFGSIAEKVIKLAQCPLLLLPSHKEALSPKNGREQQPALVAAD